MHIIANSCDFWKRFSVHYSLILAIKRKRNKEIERDVYSLKFHFTYPHSRILTKAFVLLCFPSVLSFDLRKLVKQPRVFPSLDSGIPYYRVDNVAFTKGVRATEPQLRLPRHQTFHGGMSGRHTKPRSSLSKPRSPYLTIYHRHGVLDSPSFFNPNKCLITRLILRKRSNTKSLIFLKLAGEMIQMVKISSARFSIELCKKRKSLRSYRNL